jgi:hypothetical protein
LSTPFSKIFSTKKEGLSPFFLHLPTVAGVQGVVIVLNDDIQEFRRCRHLLNCPLGVQTASEVVDTLAVTVSGIENLGGDVLDFLQMLHCFTLSGVWDFPFPFYGLIIA